MSLLKLAYPPPPRVVLKPGRFYAGLNVVAFVMIFLLVPETKQRTLEELDYVFAVPLRKFIRYQTGTMLPWWIKKTLFRVKGEKLQPLYSFEKGIINNESSKEEGSKEEGSKEDSKGA